MTLEELRAATKDLPGDTRILVLAGSAWAPIKSMKTFTESLLHVEGQAEIPKELQNRVELRIELSGD